VDVYKTEDEQLESIKRWLREHGRSVATGLLVVLAVVFSAISWQQREHNQQEAASLQYQSLLDAMRRLDQQPSKEMLATARHLADSLKTDFEKTTYAQFAALFKARLAVQDNDLTQAESELRWVLDHKPKADLAALTRFRLARVLHAKGDDAGALALLDESAAGNYAFAYEQLKGDISLAKGDSAAARTFFEKAQELERKLANPVNDPLLDIKLRDLQAAAPAAATAPSSTETASPQ